MEKKEIQTRREFFKNAAKRILPILGCLAMPSIASPAIHKMADVSVPQECNGSSCTGLCLSLIHI